MMENACNAHAGGKMEEDAAVMPGLKIWILYIVAMIMTIAISVYILYNREDFVNIHRFTVLPLVAVMGLFFVVVLWVLGRRRDA